METLHSAVIPSVALTFHFVVIPSVARNLQFVWSHEDAFPPSSADLIVIPNKRSLRREESGRAARRVAFFATQ
jgi:hypothetical protein